MITNNGFVTQKESPHSLNPRLLEHEYHPIVHVVGGDSGLESKFRAFGYRPVTDNSTGFGYSDVDIVCFTGGQDLHPRLYGQKIEKARIYTTTQRRDDDEVEYYHLYDDRPKVGICRGAQLLNVLNGGSMIQHVEHHYSDHLQTDIWGCQQKTSSVHHQMMVVPKEGQVLSWAHNVAFNPGDPTVEVEGVWFPQTKSFGVQGHPEYGPQPFTEYFFKLMRLLILPHVRAKTKGMN